MNISVILTAIGIVVTVLFGVWTIVKYRRRVELTFYAEPPIALFRGIVKNLRNVQVLYNQLPVAPNLISVRGVVVNTGKRDIAPTMVEKPMTINLKDGFRWLEAAMESTSANLDAHLEIEDQNNIVITTGLFRCGEYIRFQALAEAPIDRVADGASPSSGISKVMTLSHRIQDAKVGSTAKIPTASEYRSKKIDTIYNIFVLLMIFTALAIGNLGSKVRTLAYTVSTAPTETISVTAKPIQDDLLRLQGIESEFDTTLSPAEFSNLCRGGPRIMADRKATWGSFGFLGAFIVMLLVIIWSNIRCLMTRRRFQRLPADLDEVS